MRAMMATTVPGLSRQLLQMNASGTNGTNAEAA
jgi:hypothetical protein